MQASINQCMSQARINWEGCGRKGISGVKMGGLWGGGTVSSDCRFLCLHYLPLLHKNREDFRDGMHCVLLIGSLTLIHVMIQIDEVLDEDTSCLSRLYWLA